jgi:hypothetical protein
MDAAGAVDAQNAPTAPWKTAQTAVSHSAHTHHQCQETEEQKTSTRLTHEIPDTPLIAKLEIVLGWRTFNELIDPELQLVRKLPAIEIVVTSDTGHARPRQQPSFRATDT